VFTDGPERMTVAEIDALLYLPGHSSEQLQRALRIPALSEGWRTSFQAIVTQELSAKFTTGNPGLASEESAPAWSGFRRMRVAHIRKESDSVTSFILEPTDDQPMPPAQPGQFVVLRLQVDPSKPPILRSYSLSDLPADDHFRISVKSEANGIGSAYLCTQVRAGDVLDVSAPRGIFTLRPGGNPVVLLRSGVGATPVLSMLHALAAEASERQVWWIHGARNRSEHPFAQESRLLVKQLSHGRSYTVYSRPTAADRLQVGFDASGHVDVVLLEKIGVPRNSDFYLCGPWSFLQAMRDGLQNWNVVSQNVHVETFGALDRITPGMAQVDLRPKPRFDSTVYGSSRALGFSLQLVVDFADGLAPLDEHGVQYLCGSRC
jgi:ferredoxin-NADP reductase